MKRFARLYAELDATTSTAAKVTALCRYYAEAAPADAAWATYFLAGGRPRRAVPTATLRALACEAAGIDDWLFEACYQAVGDLAETLAHVLPPPTRDEPSLGLAEWILQRLLPLRTLPPAGQAEAVRACWDGLDAGGRFLFVKLVGGGFRVGVSRLLVQRALALHAGLEAPLLAQRMMGYTDAGRSPDAAAFKALIAPVQAGVPREAGQPYPFFLAHALAHTLAPDPAQGGPVPADPTARLGSPLAWSVEWKYDGIRAQVVRRGPGQDRGGTAGVWIWSRGEELVTDAFPEVASLAAALPEGTVLDGELLVWPPGDERPASFARLQQRLGRRTLSRQLLAQEPVRFLAYDLLEWAGIDRRGEPQRARRALLEAALSETGFQATPLLAASCWSEVAAWRAQARGRGTEGLMLKQLDAAYGVGRRKPEGPAGGGWWKWKLDPLSVDGVLVYAQAGHGRRAGLYTDYSFAVWNRAPRDAAEAEAVVEAIAARLPAAPAPQAGEPTPLQLIPFAKAYSGLSDAEFKAVDRVIRASTVDKFGPVRSVRPSLVFELGFEGLGRSARHKSGIALRFPRMLRLRPDKPLHEADTLQTLESLLRGLTDANS
jgi:DNA ligase-1